MPTKPKTNVAKSVEPPIPISAVPHLYNAQMLQWQEAQFKALQAIYERLGEILAALKEN